MSAIRTTLVLGLALSPAVALAGNGTHPRTPVVWEPEPACMTIVNRSESPVLEFQYTIPYEDEELTVDEVADSRRHQFLAFCRQHSVQLPLPSWLSQADVDEADAKDLVNPADLTADDIIDTSPEWMDCMVRVTGDDERRPINFAEAAKPVVWDTTGIPVGPYVVNGYTWEPTFNVFWLRNGVVKVVDDPDPAVNPPALAIRNRLDEDVIVFKGEDLRLFGCLDAMDGSTIAGYWASTDTEGGQLTWNMFAADVPVAGDEWELVFTPPAEALGMLIAVRVDITDPMDRTYTAHMDVLASILSEEAPVETGSGCDSSAFLGCGDSSGDEQGSGDEATSAGGTGAAGSTGDAGSGPTEAGTGGGTSDSAPQTPGMSEGCAGCAIGGPGVPLVWLICVGCLRRRRPQSA